jgi:hypothetical protein
MITIVALLLDEERESLSGSPEKRKLQTHESSYKFPKTPKEKKTRREYATAEFNSQNLRSPTTSLITAQICEKPIRVILSKNIVLLSTSF